MKISIAITTHNRYEVFKETYDNILKFMPKCAKLVVVDDGSEKPVTEASFRFDKAQGIAVAKNKCLELMGDADYYFLFDDDCYPKVKDWHLYYINTGLNHLCFSFDKFSNGISNGRKKVGEDGNIIHWHEPCGLMLFLTRKCLDVVGGFDPAYGKWGYEHVGYSMRIHNAGLTHKPFMDVKNSLDLFYSFDWDQSAKRSVSGPDRAKCIAPNERKYRSEIKASHFIPFKPLNSCIITTYFTGVVDPQRGDNFVSDSRILMPLAFTVTDSCLGLVVINDCFQETSSNKPIGGITIFINDECKINPYFQRWFSIHKYLTEHPEIDQVFCVDATDVEMQINPFPEMQKGYLYMGDEAGNKVNNEWLRKHHNNPLYYSFRSFYANHPLLNMGIVGGFREDIINFCKIIIGHYEKVKDTDMTDMALGNYACYMLLGYNKIKHGPRINTRFKANERNNTSYFKHK